MMEGYLSFLGGPGGHRDLGTGSQVRLSGISVAANAPPPKSRPT